MRFLTWTLMIALSPGYLLAREEALADLSLNSKKKIIDEVPLYLNGAAVHRRFVFSIYKVSLYLNKPTRNPEEILNSQETKYAEMLFLRNIAADDVKTAFLESFNKNCMLSCESARADLYRLNAAIPDLEENMLIEFLFRPDSTRIQGFGGRSLDFSGSELGKVFLRSWIGENPPSQRFKALLLGLTP